MRNTIVFCSWTSQIALEWLHQSCDSDLSANVLHFGIGDFPFKIPFQKLSKIFQNRAFFVVAARSGFGAAISDAFACSSFLSCKSVSADRSAMAASRLLGAAAACVILFFFEAGPHKSHWNGCIKAAILICQQMESILRKLGTCFVQAL